VYRQRLPDYELSIEQLTANVPDDGYYYVVLRGSLEGRFRSLGQAKSLYAHLKAEIGYQPPAPPEPASPEEIQQRRMGAQSNKTLLWTAEDFARVERKTRGRPKHGGGRA
jgi:hypothetical protein